MIRMLATTALGLVLANAALAQSPSTSSKGEQTPQSQSNTASQPTTPAPSATDSQRSTQSSQSSPGASTQNTQTSPPSSGSANNSSGSPNTANSADSSRPQGGATNSNNTAGNPPASQQGANPPATNTNQAQDRTNPSSSNPSSNNANQAQQAPSATGTNQAQSPNASGTSQAQGERAGANSQTASRTDVNLNRQQETRISASISHLNVRPLTNVNFSLNVGTVVPRDVQLATLPPDVVEIVPQYRGYSFALVKDQIVVVDPATYKIVTVLPYSGQSTATTTTRERSASKFSDRDREVIRKHAKTRIEGRSEARTTGSTARTEIHVGDRVPDTVEVEEFPSTVYRDAPDLREYRYIHRDSRTYMIEPRERRVIEEID